MLLCIGCLDPYLGAKSKTHTGPTPSKIAQKAMILQTLVQVGIWLPTIADRIDSQQRRVALPRRGRDQLGFGLEVDRKPSNVVPFRFCYDFVVRTEPKEKLDWKVQSPAQLIR